jgi:glycosyltransferase involved in cell wall biosynthesis
MGHGKVLHSMGSIRTTIVIPCYNQAKYLPDAIESALNQTVKCDVIVVDDGSTEDIYSAAMNYPIAFIKQENRGLSAARNIGILCARTEFVLPLDSDDKIANDMVEKCLSVDADVVGVGQETFGDYVTSHIFKQQPTYVDFRNANQVNCCSLFKKEMWQKLGGYDESMREGYEDWDFWLRASKAGYKFKTIPEILFYYRKHGKSMIDSTVQKHDIIKKYMLDKLDKEKL